MNYKSFYRKYRPTSLEDVVGQDPIVKTLLNSIKLNKINHAYIFSGTRGTGKTTVAKNFARAVNCFNLIDGHPCNECEVCKTKNTDEIQDIIEIDAASNNGVDEIRELKSKVSLVPTLCKYKVYIIDEVHMLSTGAFNALLKTLEEPPAHVIFILATTEIQKIPFTILSRCQRFDFKKINISNIVKELKYICEKENIKTDEKSLNEIARISDGSMRDAISLLDQTSLYADMDINIESIYEISGSISGEKIMNFIEYIIDENIECALDFFYELCNQGKDIYRFSEDLMLFLKNILLSINAPKYYIKQDFINKKYIENINKKIDEEKLVKIIKELNILLSEIKKNSNPNILFELFIFVIINFDKKEIKDEVSALSAVKKENSDCINEKKEIKESVEKKDNGGKIKLSIINNEEEVISEYKKILINNTIAQANKDELKNVRGLWDKIQTYLIDDDYKEASRLLLDSKVNVVGKNHILLTYKYDCMVIEHDKNNKKIKELINKIMDSDNKIVAITEQQWEELRPYYVQLKKKNSKIELLEEIENYNEEIEKEKKEEHNSVLEETINIFGKELIEMEG